MRADARKRCRFAPKNAFISRTGAGIAHGNVPRTTQKAEKESPYGYSDIILLKKNAPQTICQGAYLHKSFAARTPYVKKRTCTAAKYEKTPKILCQNCVASLFLLIFLTFCVVRDHEAMGSNPVTPTRKAPTCFASWSFSVIFVLRRVISLRGYMRFARYICPSDKLWTNIISLQACLAI